MNGLASASAEIARRATRGARERPCNSPKWGADDEIGAANLVTPERALQAIKLVKQGKTHPLGIIIDSTTPALPQEGPHLGPKQTKSGGKRTPPLKGPLSGVERTYPDPGLNSRL